MCPPFHSPAPRIHLMLPNPPGFWQVSYFKFSKLSAPSTKDRMLDADLSEQRPSSIMPYLGFPAGRSEIPSDVRSNNKLIGLPGKFFGKKGNAMGTTIILKRKPPVS